MSPNEVVRKAQQEFADSTLQVVRFHVGVVPDEDAIVDACKREGWRVERVGTGRDRRLDVHRS